MSASGVIAGDVGRLAAVRPSEATMRRSWILMTATLLVLSACTSDGVTTGSIPSSSSSPMATLPATTTSTTTPDSTSSSTTTSTTEPTTTTTTPEDAIRQAVQDYWTAYRTCGEAPETCDPAAFLAPSSDALSTASAFVAALVEAGFHFSTDHRGSFARTDSVVVDGDAATTIECIYDAGVVLGPIGPDGAPTVVNDRISSVRYTHQFQAIDGRWLVAREDKVESLGEGNQCGEA